jgi:D-amino-acid dehydrogenase
MLLDPKAPLTLRWRYLPALAPWLARFVAASAPARVRRAAAAMAGLQAHSLASYQPLLEAAGATDSVVRRGILKVFIRERTFRHVLSDVAVEQGLGIRAEIIDGGQARQMTPELSPEVRHGVFSPDGAHVLDPHGLVVALAEHLVRRGGALTRARATGFRMEGRAVRAVETDAGEHETDLVVLAAGAWSRPLARALGARVPLDTERGYHVTLPDAGIAPRVPMLAGDFSVAITSMAMGLRVAGTAELGGLTLPPDPRRVAVLRHAVRRLLPDVQADGGSEWMGFRPSMPDSLPVIGRAPAADNACLAFGHGHLGLTLAAITGRCIAEMAGGYTPAVDTRPFRAERF